MLTLGGMVCAPEDKRRLQAAGVDTTVYYRNSFDSAPCDLHIPRFTRKERIHLASEMPCADGWVPEDFEITAEDIKTYRDVYRFLPPYAELVL